MEDDVQYRLPNGPKEIDNRLVLINTGVELIRFSIPSTKKAKDDKLGLINFLMTKISDTNPSEKFTVIDGKDIMLFPSNKEKLLQMKKILEDKKEKEKSISELKLKHQAETMKLMDELGVNKIGVNEIDKEVEYVSQADLEPQTLFEKKMKEVIALLENPDEKEEREYVEYDYYGTKFELPTNKKQLEIIWWELLLEKYEIPEFIRSEDYAALDKLMEEVKEKKYEYFKLPYKEQCKSISKLMDIELLNTKG